MLIVCPSCGIKYNVPASYLSKDRTLKCASCGTSWLVKAIREPSAETAPPPAPPIPSETPAPVANEAPAVTSEPPAQKSSPVRPEDDSRSEAGKVPITAAQEPASPQASVPSEAKEEPASQQAEEPEPSPAVEKNDEPQSSAAVTEETQATVPDEAHHAESEPVSAVPVEEPATFLPSHEPEPAEAFHQEEHSPEAVVPHPEVPTETLRDEPAPEEPFTSFLDATPTPVESPFQMSDEENAFHDKHAEPDAGPSASQASEAPRSPNVHHAASFQEEDDEDEKPFSFLDLPGTRGDETSQPAPEAPDSKGPSSSYIWEEKELDNHFGQTDWHPDSVSLNESLAGEAEQLDHLDFDALHESDDHLEGGADVPWARSAHDDADHHDDHAHPEEERDAVDGRFDDVIGRIRATRNRAPEVEPPTEPLHSPHRDEHPEAHQDKHPEHDVSGEPWVPAWDRVVESTKTELEDDDGHEPIWAVHTEEKAESEEPVTAHHDASVEPVPATSEPEPVRHVTPAIDIASRLRGEVLNRTTRAPERTGSALENPQFWKKAWIASGVCAVIGLGAFVHWFSALSHIWPALSLL